MNVCPLMQVGCQYQCGTLVPRESLEKHEAQCARRPVRCDLCSKKLLAFQMSYHEHRECPERNIFCKFSSVGCTFVYKRKDTFAKDEHLKKETIAHMDLMMNEIINLRAELRARGGIGTGAEGLDTKTMYPMSMPEEEKVVTLLWSFKWTPPQNEIWSPSLRSAFGLRWGLAYGKENPSSDDDLPIYLCLKSSPLSFPIAVCLTLQLLHPKTGDEIFSRTLTNEFETSGSAAGAVGSLEELRKVGAFDETKGLTTILMCVRFTLQQDS
eukprot:TRINITY_DN12401_c0_g2_i7.p1 TRINITY_DN12401_c0_g2~~TRINITY_DN12401_c0_g2_i7.p1  ORF type:complete len:268 (-),score=1.15 TRINITY_DN12401_c0_g2_i7:96-899(-)